MTSIVKLADLFPAASPSTVAANKHLFDSPLQSPSKENKTIPRAKAARGKGMNKTEREFSLILKATHPDQIIRFEQVKLRIADNCWYCPDFFLFVDGQPTFFEVKGTRVWDDSIVKFKAAREIHSWATFELHQKKSGTWVQVL